MRILFLHGWQSTPGGFKPTYLKDHGHEVLNPALPEDDFGEAVRIAQAEFNRGKPDVLVGSSRGGAVAVNINTGDTPLVLLCPAWKTWGSATTVKPNTIILHSRADETVPFADSEELIRNSGLPESALIETGQDHRLADEESLQKILAVATVKAEATNDGKRCVRREAGVPRRFGMKMLLGITAIYAVLFAVMQVLRAPALIFGTAVLFFIALGLGQMLLFKGQHPRKASVVVGACFFPVLTLCVFVIETFATNRTHRMSADLWSAITPGIIMGAILGYLGGMLIAIPFLVIDKFSKD